MRLQRQQAAVAAGAAYANLRRNGCGSGMLPPNSALSSLARANDAFSPKGIYLLITCVIISHCDLVQKECQIMCS